MGVDLPTGLDVLLVDGQLTAASGGATFETCNPATEQVLGVAADGTASDMNAAIGSIPVAESAVLSDEAAKRLRALGYIR